MCLLLSADGILSTTVRCRLAATYKPRVRLRWYLLHVTISRPLSAQSSLNSCEHVPRCHGDQIPRVISMLVEADKRLPYSRATIYCQDD